MMAHLILLSMVLGYAAFQYGGVLRKDWNLCLLLLGTLALAYGLGTSRTGLGPLNRWLKWPALLLPGYLAFQLIPLPVSLLRMISPARAELLNAIAPIIPELSFAPLSVFPTGTLEHLFRIAAYTVTFLLVREFGWRLSQRPWMLAAPIVTLAALEAIIGLVQYFSQFPNGIARGTYVNRNHFAGLLEMALPFAVMYPLEVLHRTRSRQNSPVGPALAACAVLAVAALILLGIIHSFSRMGFVVAMSSLFLMGVLLMAVGLPAWKKWLAVDLIGTAVLGGSLFLPPDQLIMRFAQLSTAENLTAESRLSLWGETLSLIRDYPLFGCGLGAYESAFFKYKASEPLLRDDYAHNDYLQLLAEMGLIGFFIMAVPLFAALKGIIRVVSQPELDNRYLALACTGSIAAILLHSLVDFNLYIPANAMLLAWVLGISVSPVVSSQAVVVQRPATNDQFRNIRAKSLGKWAPVHPLSRLSHDTEIRIRQDERLPLHGGPFN